MKFDDPRQTEVLSVDSLKIIDELSMQGRPLPAVINNASLKNEMDLVTSQTRNELRINAMANRVYKMVFLLTIMAMGKK